MQKQFLSAKSLENIKEWLQTNLQRHFCPLIFKKQKFIVKELFYTSQCRRFTLQLGPELQELRTRGSDPCCGRHSSIQQKGNGTYTILLKVHQLLAGIS